MKKVFYKLYFKSIIPDFLGLLTMDVNSEKKLIEISRDEINFNMGNYFEIVWGQRRVNLFKQFLPRVKFSGLAYEQKIKFNRRVFSGNN